MQYTIGQAASKLGVTTTHLRQLQRQAGVVPTRTQGGHRRYSDEDLNRIDKVLNKDSSRWGKVFLFVLMAVILAFYMSAPSMPNSKTEAQTVSANP